MSVVPGGDKITAPVFGAVGRDFDVDVDVDFDVDFDFFFVETKPVLPAPTPDGTAKLGTWPTGAE